MTVRRTHFADDWHCGTQGCGCWKTKDIERDKAFLAKIFKDDNGKPANVLYAEYKKDPDEGKESRDKNIYHVRVKRVILTDNDLFTVAWHGFWLQWVAAARKDIIDLAFERVGIWEE